VSEQWYFDLRRGVAVPAAQRGPGDDMLGPYASRAEAENWRSTVEQRNDTWDDADEAWNERDDTTDKTDKTGET